MSHLCEWKLQLEIALALMPPVCPLSITGMALSPHHIKDVTPIVGRGKWPADIKFRYEGLASMLWLDEWWHVAATMGTTSSSVPQVAQASSTPQG